MWGCLNPIRKKIQDRDLRGFLLTKQGFALGTRANMARHFGKRTTYFDRYVGEIVVVEAGLLPNAARTDFEPSAIRTSFYEALAQVASEYYQKADEHQELTKGDELLDEAIERIRKIETTISFNAEKADQLLDAIVDIRSIRSMIEGRLSRSAFREERTSDAQKVMKSARSLEKQIQDFIESSKRQRRKGAADSTPEAETRKRLRNLPRPYRMPSEAQGPGSLVEVLEAIDLSVSDDLKKAMELLDEKFIQSVANNRTEYLRILGELKDEMEEAISEGV